MKLLPKKIYNRKLVLLAAGVLSAFGAPMAHAQVTSVFYILLENRNWTNGGNTGAPAQIQGSSAAPYLNAITTPGNPAAADVSYASCYHNVLAVATGTSPNIHPSEPNYVWMECGSNLSKADDNDPYGSGASVQQIFNYAAANPNLTTQNLSALFQNAGLTWKSYTEGTNLLNTNGQNFNTAGGTLSNNSASPSQYTVPLVSFSGTSASYINPYNGSNQYNFAAKHTGQLFFPATNGSTINAANQTTSNALASHYPPLEQLQNDLTNGTYANYNVITPDQYNDMHTALSNGFTYTATAANHMYGTGVHYTGDLSQMAQGDNFCAIVVPRIQATAAYQAGHVAIVLWTDETEGTPANTFGQTLLEIVLSKGNTKGNAYNSTLNYTHSSDLATMQRLFGLTANTPSGYLNDAANYSNSSGTLAGSALGYGTGIAQDLSDLFVPGVIPSGIPGLNLAASGYSFNRHTGTYSQTVTVSNTLSTPVTNPVYLVVGNLSSNATLSNSAGTTVNNQPGSPYVLVSPTGLGANASTTVTLQYTATGTISNTMSVIQTSAQP
jgi:hypothetical protein